MVKRPVFTGIAHAFLCIILLSLLTTGVAFSTLFSSLRDTEAVNLAGSLRMQIYRIAYDLETSPYLLPEHRQHFTDTLNSPLFHPLKRAGAPREVQSHYIILQRDWQEFERHIQAGDKNWLNQNIAQYTANIDTFVLSLQRSAEHKMEHVALMSLIGFFAIFILVYITLRRIRQQVVEPLGALAQASRSIERRNFNFPPLDTHLPNELGQLACSFTQMAQELHKLYQSLEENVQQKNRSLKEANRRLKVLYSCSRAMNASVADNRGFQRVLRIARHYGPLCALEMQDNGGRHLLEGTPQDGREWQQTPIMQGGNALGFLRWQADERFPGALFMKSISTMLGRGLWFAHTQQERQQLLVMEERAAIARELHDSLAQALSYLRIQLTLLKRAVVPDNQRAQQIIADFSQALNDANRELRELLATFRLSLQQASFPAALHAMIAPLRERTDAAIILNGNLPDDDLDAASQVHLLQIIREALLNAIRHAQAKTIAVTCHSASDGERCVEITDDGKGIDSLEGPAGHHGLNIMYERAALLGGTLDITRRETGGTRVCVHLRSAAEEKGSGNGL
ncbi:nitrate/nitrite two-component system sensor histidine kinase NarQ [Erwinia sp. HR93]|uniref:nitrate/nitrite two-component system sensor histidine kinase NarQ n=1 Tax=Erwinia sp. HR93 TaxID=3094840 RepID=UPI002ADEEC36|nr:nitrate/nitrite two-component system sensor histidine kinase NarQ [Erwinia sp. HR93]MEA1065648.1 nitrate/nitrite two-component system sensor histidine kinase NarQ [Erwinia sp. HR93]